jgi:hypothetical protein
MTPMKTYEIRKAQTITAHKRNPKRVCAFAQNVIYNLEPTERAYLMRHQEMKHLNKNNIQNVWTLCFSNH